MAQDKTIVRCYGCERWVELIATELFETVMEGDVASLQRWCLSCKRQIDEATKEALQESTDYPLGLPEWEEPDNKDGE